MAVSWAWSHWQLPIWLPWQAYGINLAANQGNPWFWPEILCHLILPSNYSVWNVVALFFLAYGAYLCSCDLGLDVMAGFITGLFAALSGPALPDVNLGMWNPLMLLPYTLIAARRALQSAQRQRVWQWMLIFVLLIDSMGLSSFDEGLPLVSLSLSCAP